MLKKTFGHVGHAPACCAAVFSLVAIAAQAQVQYLRNAASTGVNRHSLRLASWFATEQTFKRPHGTFVGLPRNFFAIMRRPDMGIAAKGIKDIGPEPQSFDIERATKENSDYRSVAWSGRYLQVTLMSIPPGSEIGLEAHPQTDQFLRLDAGRGLVQMGAAKDKLTFEKEVSNGWCVLVPAGTWHNITNTGITPMQVYTIYAPAHHAPDKVQVTAAAAKADKDDEPAAWSVQPKHTPDKHG